MEFSISVSTKHRRRFASIQFFHFLFSSCVPRSWRSHSGVVWRKLAVNILKLVKGRKTWDKTKKKKVKIFSPESFWCLRRFARQKKIWKINKREIWENIFFVRCLRFLHRSMWKLPRWTSMEIYDFFSSHPPAHSHFVIFHFFWRRCLVTTHTSEQQQRTTPTLCSSKEFKYSQIENSLDRQQRETAAEKFKLDEIWSRRRNDTHWKIEKNLLCHTQHCRSSYIIHGDNLSLHFLGLWKIQVNSAIIVIDLSRLHTAAAVFSPAILRREN